MNRITIGASIAVAAIALTPAIAQVGAETRTDGHSRAEVQSKVARHFARLDSNRDGFVTRAESDAMRAERRERRGERIAERRANRFDRLDTNQDGQLSRAEFDAAHALRDRRWAARPGRALHGRLHGRMFELADSNRDGRVSLQEAQAAALRHFDMADANRDGTVTREERREMRRRHRAERRAS